MRIVIFVRPSIIPHPLAEYLESIPYKLVIYALTAVLLLIIYGVVGSIFIMKFNPDQFPLFYCSNYSNCGIW